MLDDWFFCSAMYTPDRQTYVFLSTLDVLDDPRAPVDVVCEAMAQLEAADSWLRLYGLPRAFAAARRFRPGPSFRPDRPVDEAIERVIVRAAEPLGSALERVARTAVLGHEPAEIVAAANEAATTLGSLRPGAAAVRPHADIEEAAGRVVLLASLLEAGLAWEESVAELSAAMQRQPILLSILEEALGGNAGRLPLLLAVRLADHALPGRYSPEALVDRVWLEGSRQVGLQPDLLAAIAQVKFRPRLDVAQGTGHFDDLRKEAETWSWLRQRCASAGPSGEDDLRAERVFASILGVEGRVSPALPALLWQAVLWDLAASWWPGQTAAALARTWLPPEWPASHQHWVSVEAGVATEAEGATWAAELRELAVLRRAEHEVPRIEARRAPRADMGAQLRPWCFSPWLYRVGKPPRGKAPYPALLHVAPMLRFLSAVHTVRVLLRHLAGDDEQPIRVASWVLELLLHAGDVLNIFENLPDRLDLPAALIGLGRYSAQSLQRLGQGDEAVLDPAQVLEFVSQWTPMPDLAHTQRARLRGLPAYHVAMRWLQRGLSAAVAPYPNARWLAEADGGTLAEAFLDSIVAESTSGRFDRRLLVNAATLLGAYFPGHPVPRLDGPDWTEAVDRLGQLLRWRVWWQDLLLTPDLMPDDWARPDWPEPELGGDDLRQGATERTILVRDTERVASLLRHGWPDRYRQYDAWVDCWLGRIGAVNNRTKLPQLFKRRVLMLLAPELVIGAAARVEIFEELVETMVEFGLGTPKDVAQLFTSMAADGLHGATRDRLRARLLRAVYFHRRSVVDTAGRVPVKDPREGAIDAEMGALLGRRLGALALTLAGQVDANSGTPFPELLELYWRRAALTRPAAAGRLSGPRESLNTSRTTRVAVDVANDERHLHEDPGALAVPGEPGTVHDLFAVDDADRQARRVPASDFVLGVVCDVDGGVTRYNIGAGMPVTGRAATPGEPPEVGDLFALKLVPVREDESPIGLAVARVHRLAEPAPAAGEVRIVTIRAVEVHEHVRRTVLRLEPDGAAPVTLDHGARPDLLKVWDPDVRRAFRAEPGTWTLPARWDGHDWWPVDGGLAELLAQVPGSDAALWITFIGTGMDRRGMPGWRFASSPGRSFLLREGDCLPETAAELGYLLADEPHGLRIPVRGACDRDESRLALAGESDRSIVKWRQLLEGDATVRAVVRAGDRWVLDTVIEGLPPVTIAGGLRAGGHLEVRILPAGESDVRLGRVWAEELRQRYLQDHLRPTWQRFRKVLGLRAGSPIVLRSVLTSRGGQHDALQAFTDDGVGVLVDAESITMRPLSEQVPNSLREGRDAVITWVSPVTVLSLEVDGELFESRLRVALGEQASLLDGLTDIDGVLAAKPSADEPAASCTLWFGVGDGHVTTCLLDLGQPTLAVGDRVRATRKGGGWRLVAEHRILRARALWRMADAAMPDGFHLGLTTFAGGPCWITQAADQPLLLRSPVGPSEPGHLEPVGRVRGAGIDLSRCVLRAGPGRARRPGDPMLWERWRVNAGAASLAGEVRGGLRGDTSLAGIRVAVLRGDDPKLYDIRRELVVRGQQAHALPEAGREEEANQARRVRLDHYLRDPQPLRARLVSEGRVVVDGLEVPGPAATWSNLIRLAANEAPAVNRRDYSPYGARVLVLAGPDEGTYHASYRAVPPLDLAAFVREYDLPTDRPVEMTPTLYFAGWREAPEFGGRRYLLFEWGFGRTVQMRWDQVTFAGAATAPTELLPLFFGDAIRQARFVQCEGGLVMDVTLCLQEDGTRLFRQARDHQVVHLLRIRADGDRIQVEDVQGVNERAPMPGGRYEPWRQYQVGAMLDEASVERLRAVWTRNGGAAQRPSIFARLDTERFEGTLGRDIVYRYVELSVGEDDHQMRDGDLLFLRAGLIEPLPNDVGLHLEPLQDTQPWRGPDDLRSRRQPLMVRRRQFSRRESLLGHFLRHTEKHERSLEGTPLLVRIIVDRRSEDRRLRPTLLEPPPRTQAVYADMLAAGAGSGYAVVGSQADDHVLLECDVAVTVAIGRERIDGPVPVPGSWVRVEERQGRFQLLTAVPSDREYVPQDGRDAIVLPKQTLIGRGMDRARVRHRGEHFTVAGLSDLGARIAGDAALEILMGQPHPKIRTVRPSTSDGAIEVLATDTGCAGVLDVSGDQPVVRPCGGSADVPPVSVEWAQLSFADVGVAQIREACARPAWSYHDGSTGWWRTGEPGVVPQNLPLGASATVEPVFFSSWSLRYRTHELRRFGYSARDLVDALDSARLAHRWLPVAGVSYRTATPGEPSRGLWLELAPGRVVEVLGDLVNVRTGDRPRPVPEMAWELFAPGDQVRISVESVRPTEPASIVLEDWRPGPRRAFQRAHALLLAAPHRDGKSTRLGLGRWRLTHPTFPPAGGYAWLAPDNRVTIAHDAAGEARSRRARGDEVVALLGLDADGAFVVHGLPGYRAVSDGPVDERHRWLVEALRTPARAAALFDACGGSLPVTVESIGETALLFSFRLQPWTNLKPGRAARAVAIGLDGEDSIVLSAGAALFRLPAQAVVPGVPAESVGDVVTWLVRHGEPVWLHSDAGELRCGIAGSLGADEVEVEPLHVVGPTGGSTRDEAAGVLCRDTRGLRLCWMPASEVAWTDLDLAELRSVLRRSGPITARPTVRGLSAIQVTGVQRLLDSLRAGDTVRATVERPLRGAGVYLVRTYPTGTLLRLEATGEVRRAGELLLAEVATVQRLRPARITLVPRGERRRAVGLPGWAFDREHGGLATAVPGRFRDYARWYDSGLVDSIPDLAEPDAALMAALGAVVAGRRHLPLGVIARAWLERHGEDLLLLDPGRELDLVPALAAVRVLAEVGRRHGRPATWLAVQAAWAVGLRAACSLHLEPVIRSGLLGPGDADPGLLWARTRLVAGTMRAQLGADELDQLRLLVRGVLARTSLDPEAEVRDAVLGLWTAVGGAESSGDATPHHRWLDPLVALLRALTPTHAGLPAQPALSDSQVAALDRLVLDIMPSSPPLTLLPPGLSPWRDSALRQLRVALRTYL